MKSLYTERTELVVKSNDLIRKTRYSLTEQEQKIVIYLISKIQADDKELREVEISILDFCKLCNINYDGTTSKAIKNAIKRLADKSWWLMYEGEEVLFRWIDKAKISKGTVKLRLCDFLTPFLIELKQNFTKYELINVLSLKGKYSIRLYEILKSYLWQHKVILDLEDLKKTLQCPDYKAYKDFRIRVLDYSIDEINNYTDLNISYNTIKDGRKIVALEFEITEKHGIQMSFDMYMNQQERLDK